MRCVLLVVILYGTAQAGDRVTQARTNVGTSVQAAFEAVGLQYPPQELHLRAFKTERVIEVWASDKKGQPLTHVKDFAVCAASGELGPKRKRGDLQVPEGLYEIERFNPVSNFHLSMKVNYPNASDRVLGARGNLGGDIFIHGNCASVGCLAIEDGPIEELYVMASDTVTRPIAVHIFPRRMENAAPISAESPHAQLWRQLETAYRVFARTRRPPAFKVDPRTGAYWVLANVTN